MGQNAKNGFCLNIVRSFRDLLVSAGRNGKTASMSRVRGRCARGSSRGLQIAARSSESRKDEYACRIMNTGLSLVSRYCEQAMCRNCRVRSGVQMVSFRVSTCPCKTNRATV